MALLAVEIQTGSSSYLRLVEGDVVRTIEGQTYSPAPFTVSAIRLEGMQQVVVRLYNTDGAISGPDEAEPFVEHLRTLRVLEVHFSTAGVQLDPVVLFSGHVLGVRYNLRSAEVRGGYRSASSVGQVGRICGRLCNYRFRDDNCGYSGYDTTCTKTLAACTAKGNQARYGGFPTMPQRGAKISYTLVQRVAPVGYVGSQGYPVQAIAPVTNVSVIPDTQPVGGVSLPPDTQPASGTNLIP
ncbi:MAG TPA: hypothetical protein PKN27_04910 [Propionibacteriaceae bacterium]|nr:hypothetical protein [Propionibacteriaceae bacterium]